MLVSFFLAAVVTLVGLRLMALGISRRAIPELTLGVTVVLAQPGTVLLNHALTAPSPALIPLALGCVTAGTAGVGLFAQITFRPGVGWARVLVGLMAAFLAYTHTLQVPLLLATGEPHLLYLSARLLVVGWAAFEALRHRAMYARRRRIGMYDPVIGNRFLLFGGWMSLMALNAVGTMLIVGLGQHFGFSDWRTPTFGFARAITVVLLTMMWLIFFPPRRYLIWLEQRHADRTPPEAEA